MTRCYIGLGSNLANAQGDSIQILRDAVKALAKIGTVQVSQLYHTPPMGPQDQPDYWNAVAMLDTELQALELLDYLQACEQAAGRVRLRHWGERTLDLDLLLYGDEQIQHERLTVPHAGILQRDFVLIPLLDLDADLQILGQRIAESDVVQSSPLKPYQDSTWANE
ncbi:MAG: 2-amino-4-hydroxy-6-hydroxymethyldihydropteridine diphosphokinase [Acinetobacter sp.]|nr:2-amino-4-hydroxy-6-hydroxymethyldihydropteridine diphosphokinase [Acinetobacter sp.]